MARQLAGIGQMYDGESGDLERFESMFNYEALMFAWDDTQKAAALKFCLTGKAQRYYNELSATQQADVKEVFKKIKEGCANAPEFYMNLFYVRTLKPNESVSAYCNDIQHLLEKAMPGLEETTRDKFL